MIVTVTLNPSLDISCRCSRVLPRRKIRCRNSRLDPGGGGINVCRVCRELGGDAAAVWMRGGESGEILGSLLNQAGVVHYPVDMKQRVRHSMYVLEEKEDQEYRFVLPGARITEVEIENVVRTMARLDNMDYLVFSGSLPPGASPECYSRILRQGPNARGIVDTSGDALQHLAQAGVFLIKPNLRELAKLVGKERLESDNDIDQAARDVIVRDGGPEYILVSRGADGAQLVSAEDSIRLQAPKVKRRSSVGAGDSMVAGVVVGLAMGKSVRQAARLGVAAGTAAVTTPGTELCRREDVERLYENVKESPR